MFVIFYNGFIKIQAFSVKKELLAYKEPELSWKGCGRFASPDEAIARIEFLVEPLELQNPLVADVEKARHIAVAFGVIPVGIWKN